MPSPEVDLATGDTETVEVVATPSDWPAVSVVEGGEVAAGTVDSTELATTTAVLEERTGVEVVLTAADAEISGIGDELVPRTRREELGSKPEGVGAQS